MSDTSPLLDALDRICMRIHDAGADAASLHPTGFVASGNGTATMLLATNDEHGDISEDYVLELKLIPAKEAGL